MITLLSAQGSVVISKTRFTYIIGWLDKKITSKYQQEINNTSLLVEAMFHLTSNVYDYGQ